MKTQDLKTAYEDASKTAGEIVRNLAFAGVAIVWVFRVSNTELPEQLLLTLLLIAGTLFFDFFQYITTTIIYFLYFRSREKQNQVETFEGSILATIPGWTLFFLKCALLILSYITLVSYLAKLWLNLP